MASSALRFKHFNQPLDTWSAENQPLLGAIAFSPKTHSVIAPVLHAPMPGTENVIEAWYGNHPVTEGELGDIRYRHDSHWLFGVIEMPESEASPGFPPLQHATASAYRQLFALMDTLKYPVSLRFWNYMRDINGITHGLERYQQFNLGRQEAFLASGRQVTGDLPAACALGLQDGPLCVAFLAGRKSGLSIENPRQISAFDYPPDYGPRSPTFSRAYLLPEEGLLLISGTASILGHKTVHNGDVLAQTRETLANLHAVIAEANKHLPGFDAKNMACRVYVRHIADIPLIAQEIQHAWGAHVRIAYLQADICRADLLLEIEACANIGEQLPCD